jgi:hypothetical protein
VITASESTMTMRRLLLFVVAAIAVTALGAGPSAAQDYPFCRKAEAGPGDCRYSTLEQCQEAVSGTSGYCQPNYWLPQTSRVSPHRRARRS